MLCNVCNNDIFDGDNLICSICNAFLHFGCAALRETAFRKMSKTAKQNWSCNICKFTDQNIKLLESKNNVVSENKNMNIVSNENFKSLIDSVNCMSDKFDSFGKQLQELIATVIYIKEENQILKEQNFKLKNEVSFLDKRLNFLEQKTIENYVEIMGVPESSNEDCVKTVESIATTDETLYEDSDLHKINTSAKNPIELFGKWYNEHMMANVSVTSAKAFSLATVSKAGHVSCRSLILRRLDEDGFVMMTDGRSRKSKDLEENPQASMLFLWLGKTADNLPHTRQVRIEGSVKKLSTDNMQELYDIEPLFCKIRAQICEQGKVVEWEQLKRDHDQLFNKVVKSNVQLPKPDHVIAYKLVPNVIEFYEAVGLKIGDRLLFVKDGIKWESKHIAA